MTAVVFKFTLPTGEPLVDAEFTVSLRKPGMFFDDAPQGIAVPDDVIGRTDAEGKCTLELLPLELSYYLTLQMGGSDGNEDGCTSGFRFRFRVPESASPVDIVDLVVTDPTWSQAWDEKALGVIIDARVAAVDAAERAKASELAAEADAQATAADRVAVDALAATAGQHETNAINARDAAQAYATNAAASAQETDADRIATAALRAEAESVAESTALNVLEAFEATISEIPAPGRIPKAGANGKLTWDWVPYIPLSPAQAAAEEGADLIGFSLSVVGSAVRTAASKLREIASVLDFGAVGDGVTDDSPAFQAAADWAAWFVGSRNCGVVIAIPANAYRLKKNIVCKVTATSSAQRSIHFAGQGIADSVLIADASNIYGIFKCGSVTNNEVWGISGVAIASDLPENAPTNNGNAIDIDTDQEYQGPGWGDRPLHSVWIKDVQIAGFHSSAGFARRGNWATGIRIHKKWNPKIINTRLLTRYGKNPTNPRTGGGGLKGIDIEACYSPWFQYVYVHGNWEYGIHVHGVHNASEDYEGGTFDHVNVVNADYGLFWEHSYDTYTPQKRYEPGGNIVACHFDCYKENIWIRSHQQISIVATSIYVPANSEITGGAPIPCGIHFDGAANVKADIQFRGGFYNSPADFSAAVKITGYSDTLQLPCTFESAGVCFYNNSLKSEKTINVTGCSFTRRVQEGTQGTQVKFMDLANGIYGSYTEQVTEGGVWRKRTVAEASQTGITTSLSYVLSCNNTDYSTQAAPGLGAYEVHGNDKDGARVPVSSIRSSWVDNTVEAGKNRGKVDFLVRRDGALSQALQASYADAELNSSIVAQFYINGTWYTKRVEIGALNSGGTDKRALVVSN